MMGDTLVYNRPVQFDGLNIVVVPSVITYTPTWKERFFSWPWRPWEKSKMKANPAAPKDGKYLRIGRVIYCNERSYRDLTEKIS